jgi:hypothetical protein
MHALFACAACWVQSKVAHARAGPPSDCGPYLYEPAEARRAARSVYGDAAATLAGDLAGGGGGGARTVDGGGVYARLYEHAQAAQARLDQKRRAR